MAFTSMINPSILCCSIISCTLLLVSLSDGQQVTCENPAAWVGVPEAEYDMSYASINDPAGRPLGFNRSTIPYRDSGSPDPCITIGNDINNRRIEVMAESNPPGNTVCVYREGLNEICDPLKIYLCEQTTGNSVRYTFYCPAQSCTDQDVPFLFRFTVSPPASEGDPELWCGNRETDQYPSTLTPVCPQCVKIPPPPATTPSDGQQVTCENPAAWVGVPEAEYDMSYASINDPAGRPLGFNRSTVPYRDSGSPNPCITVGNDINNRRIEVMAESNPPGNVVCVSRKGLQDLCDPVQIYLCEQTTGDSVRYTFYCPAQSCTDQDVPFLFRFTVSPPASEGDPELWCGNRETDQYPSTLTPVCPQCVKITPPPATTPSGSPSTLTPVCPQCVKITPPPATTPSGSPNVGFHRVLLVAAGCVTVFLALF